VWYGLLTWFSHPHPQGDAHWLGQRARYWVTAYFGLCTGLLYLTAWPGLGWITGLPIALYAVLVYALLTGALMLAMLQHRSHFQVKQQEQLAADARLAEHRAEQERATRLDREKLLAMLGHELKTPLAAMRMLLGHPGVAAPLQRPLQAAVTEMGQVVERTLEAGLVEDLARAVHLEVCDLAELVQKQIDALEAPERVQLAWPEPGTCHLHTDPQLLDIVLRNLLGNALKYSPADSMVRVHLNQHGTGWRLAVENHPGQAGLPDPGRVFEKYYRSPQARHRSGSGLGLYMVRALTEAMGGSITYEFRAGMACFVLILGAASKAPGRAE
jgi:signal transduction histidine kinase